MMYVKVANAPVSWGVDYADGPNNPAWPAVMDGIRAAGYEYTELGPYGYYPTDRARLRAEFEKRGLSVTGGFIFQVLHDPAMAESVLEVTRRTVDLLSAVGGKSLVTIDHISAERMATAGRADLAVPLEASRRAHMVSLIDQIADIALAKGVTPVLHQHAGCYIEFEQEIEDLLGKLDDGRVGLCIDTGHMTYAGIDPVAFFRRHKERVKYFHFKDIEPSVHARVLAGPIPFLTAVQHKVFCPIGTGMVDWTALVAALQAADFKGAATVEQDIDPALEVNPLEDARKSRTYLRSIGL
jgi:inosose dehydratase